MKVVDHIIHDHELLINFKIIKTVIYCLCCKLLREHIAIPDFVKFLHYFRFVLADFLDILGRFKVADSSLLVQSF